MLEKEEDDIDVLKARKLCFRCVGEEFWKEEIRTQGKRGKCSYCGKTRQQYSIETLADRVENAFEQYYERTANEPDSIQYIMMKDKESTYDWEREGEPVIWAIMNAGDFPEKAAADIQQVLADKHSSFDSAMIGEETEFSSEIHYAEKGLDAGRWQEEWHQFERSLKTEARFFSQSAAGHLASVFDGIDTMRTHDGRSIVVTAGPDTYLPRLYRARVFQSHERLEEALARPDRHLGSPPSSAAAAGRMNARGISVFYGATSALAALGEVRPPVGSDVVVARFDIIRPIRLLDLTALRTAWTGGGSIFDPAYIDRVERAAFLRNLSSRIVRPVMPDDELFEYLATQAISDFLATEISPTLDGIIFPSVQAAADALNVVLFHKASFVEQREIPPKTDINVSSGHSTEDGWETDYHVAEWLPGKDSEPEPEHRSDFEDWDPNWTEPHLQTYPATLSIDLETVYVHHVQGVIFQTEDHQVTWSRYDHRESDF